MPQTTIQTTVEELFDPNSDIGADADISVTFDMQPPERATRDYPGCPATVEQVGWAIDSYCLYDDMGNEPAEGNMSKTPEWLKGEIEKWVESNDELLIELACEAEAAKAEDWRY